METNTAQEIFDQCAMEAFDAVKTIVIRHKVTGSKAIQMVADRAEIPIADIQAMIDRAGQIKNGA
jgi:hypothetical protein